MAISRFEDIEGWQMARELSRRVYAACRTASFSSDFALRDQIVRASGSVMHNIAEGFDADTNAEFARFLGYSRRSCTEVQSQLYVALDEGYITQDEFDDLYERAAATRAKVWGFIRYLRSADKP